MRSAPESIRVTASAYRATTLRSASSSATRSRATLLIVVGGLVVMDPTAYLSDPQVRYGLPASPGCQVIWPHLTSRAVAKELMFSGRRVDADEALRLGLANRVTALGDDVHVALELAAELAAMPATGVAEIKRTSNAPLLDELSRLELPSAW